MGVEIPLHCFSHRLANLRSSNKEVGHRGVMGGQATRREQPQNAPIDTGDALAPLNLCKPVLDAEPRHTPRTGARHAWEILSGYQLAAIRCSTSYIHHPIGLVARSISMNSFVAGMTVNERLSHFGLFDAFDAAVQSRDVAAIVAVLRQAELTEAQALDAATAILAKTR